MRGSSDNDTVMMLGRDLNCEIDAADRMDARVLNTLSSMPSGTLNSAFSANAALAATLTSGGNTGLGATVNSGASANSGLGATLTSAGGILGETNNSTIGVGSLPNFR